MEGYTFEFKEGKEEGYLGSRYFQCWHTCGSFSMEKGGTILLRCRISDMFGGCGVQMMHGWYVNSNFAKKEQCDLFIKELLKQIHRGVGMVVAQVGQDFYKTNFVKSLEDNGFEVLKEYNNWQHGSGYKQKLYGLTIKK